MTVRLWFRAFTTERTLLPLTLAAGEAMAPEAHERVRLYVEKYGAGAGAR